MLVGARYLVLVLCCLGAASCVSSDSKNLNSLEFLSVRRVAAGDPLPPEISPSRGGALLLIRLSGGYDLNQFARAHEYNIFNEVTLCTKGDVDPSKDLQNYPYLYDTQGMVNANRQESESKPGQAEHVYFIYVAIVPAALRGQQTFYYDLRARPQDVCARVRGGNMIGQTFVSNTIVIPSSAIAAALN